MNANSTACSSTRSVPEFPFLMPEARDAWDVKFGWILTWADSDDVCLLKPFSRARIQLPNFKTFPDYEKHRCSPESYFIRRAWIIDDPSDVSTLTLLVLVNRNNLGFWRNGDEGWTKINHKFRSPVMNCICGEIFILDFEGNLLVWDPQETDLSNPQDLVSLVVHEARTSYTYSRRDYLVADTNDDVLIIRRNNTGIAKYLAAGADQFTVLRLDLSETLRKAIFVEIKDLGNDCIFLGDNTTTSVIATKYPGVLKPNCIYFTDDCFDNYFTSKNCPKGGKDMGIYNVGDGSIERFEVESYSHISSPLWMFPSF